MRMWPPPKLLLQRAVATQMDHRRLAVAEMEAVVTAGIVAEAAVAAVVQQQWK